MITTLKKKFSLIFNGVFLQLTSTSTAATTITLHSQLTDFISIVCRKYLERSVRLGQSRLSQIVN